jgi:hypothetical protein
MLAGCTGDGSGQVAGIDRGGAVGPITGLAASLSTACIMKQAPP